MEQDWGITFHQEDSFILGYLGSEIGTSDSSKDRLQSCRQQGEKKSERSSNPIPSPKGHLWHICLTCSQKPSKTKCLWSIPQGVFRATIPRTWKEASVAPCWQRSCTAQLPLVSPQAAKAIWHCGEAGCYISQCQLPTKAKNPLWNKSSHTDKRSEDFFLAPKRVAAEPGAYCTVWEDFAPS